MYKCPKCHQQIAGNIKTCPECNFKLKITLEEYKAISPVFEDDIYDAISIETCIDKRNTIGAPGPKAMEEVIAINDKWLKDK